MFETFFPILLLVGVATILAFVLTGFSIFLGRRTHMGKKGQAYECGVDPTGSTKEPIPVKYFLVAISFIVFDVELIFLLPWAVVARDLGMFGFVSILIFVTVVIVGFIYEVGKGGLKWD